MNKSKWSLLLILGLVLSLFLAACSGGDDDAKDKDTDTDKDTEQPAEETPEAEEPADEEKVLRLSASAEIPTMDPALAEDSESIQWQDVVYEGLFRVGPGGQLVDGVAIYDESGPSEDGLTWTFKLRDNATWSDGSPVTANDFVYAWQRAINPDTGSFYAAYLMNGVIKNATQVNAGELPLEDLGVTAEDDHTLVVELEKPTPYFSSFGAFATFHPLKQEFVEAQGENFALETENILGNGPFVFETWEHEAKFVFAKNENYWDAETVQLDRIEVNVVKDTATRISLYETGEIDRVGLSGEFVDQYKTDPDYKSMSEMAVFWLKFNQGSSTAGDKMANENFRKALAKAFDKQAFIDIVYGNDSIPADYFVPQDFVQHPESGEDFRAAYPANENVAYDVDAAKEHWAAAKEELGFDTVTLTFLSGDTDVSKDITEFFKSQLETNLEGLTLEAVNVPWAEQLEIMKEQTYELTFSGWGPDYKDAISFVDLWVTGGENNDVSYSNADYDELVKAAKGELATDLTARFEAMQEAEQVILDEAGIGPVMQRRASILSKPYVKGMDALNPFGPDYSYKWVDIQK